MAAIAQLGGGQRQHPAKLAAAQDADRTARGRIMDGHPGRSRDDWRSAPRASRRAGSRARRRIAARIEAASSPAFVAPAAPIASVPTGMPPRHLHDRKQAVEAVQGLRLATGTPSTGNRVMLATMPGRCAAPPAPAMMTLKPAPSAPLAKSTSRSGVRWAETIRLHAPRPGRPARRPRPSSFPSRTGCP